MRLLQQTSPRLRLRPPETSGPFTVGQARGLLVSLRFARSIQGLPSSARETGRSMQSALHPAGEARYPGSSAHGLTLTFSGEVHGGRPEGTAFGASSVCNGMLGQGPTLCEGPPLVSALGARTQTGRDHARFAPFARSDPGRTCSNKLRHGYGRARRRRAAPSRQVSPVACP